MKIVGVYRAPPLMPETAQQGIFLPVELMKQIPGMYFESALNQLTAGGSPTAAAATPALPCGSAIRPIWTTWKSEIHGMGYHTQTVLSKLQDMRRFFLAIQLLLTVVGSIALGIAALGIVNTLLMAVLERYQEIGLCKAIGASDGDLFVLFLTEAGIIGLLGGLTGIALGWLMSWGMEVAASIYAHRQGIAGNLDLFAFPALAAGRLDCLCRRRQRGGRHLSRLAGCTGRSDPRPAIALTIFGPTVRTNDNWHPHTFLTPN